MTTTFDIDALRTAHHRRDPEAMTELYADDAVLTVVDATHPPSNPQRLQGREQIHAFMEDLMSRDMTHDVPDAVVGLDMVSWTTHCRYATGERVVAMDVAKLRDGRIVEDTIVQAWDE